MDDMDRKANALHTILHSVFCLRHPVYSLFPLRPHAKSSRQMSTPDITLLLDRVRAGDPDAFSDLVGRLYDELRVIAHAQRRRLGAADTVNTTAVVHEAYAKLAGRDANAQSYTDRGHFFRIAARAMRDVIVDYARAKNADKRGGSDRPLPLDSIGPIAEDGISSLDPTEVLSLNDALLRLERIDPESARVAELRYFAGLANTEVAEALDYSLATVKRRWTFARAWLYRALNDEPSANREPSATSFPVEE